MSRRILYVLFTDPTAYPPIEHSTSLFAERGWDVTVLGTNMFAKDPFHFPLRPGIHVKKLRMGKPQGNKLKFVAFCIWVLYWALIWKPEWIYASDPLSSPVLWLIRKFISVRTVYHEHDSPVASRRNSWFMKVVLSCRERLGKDAELCILPQRERLIEFEKSTRRKKPSFCVWNCPRKAEVTYTNLRRGGNLVLYYHGSITPARVPVQLITAAGRFNGAVKIQIAGPEAPGSVGYLRVLREHSREMGFDDLIEVVGPVALRSELLERVAMADIGLSFLPKLSPDINMRHMVGASNKPFDYMACGLPLLVTDLPDWVSTFVSAGYGRACDSDSSDSIEQELRWYLDHPNERLIMGRKCRDKIRYDWNYESTFQEALACIEGV